MTDTTRRGFFAALCAPLLAPHLESIERHKPGDADSVTIEPLEVRVGGNLIRCTYPTDLKLHPGVNHIMAAPDGVLFVTQRQDQHEDCAFVKTVIFA